MLHNISLVPRLSIARGESLGKRLTHIVHKQYCRSGNFMLKIIRVKNFRGVRFSRFVQSANHRRINVFIRMLNFRGWSHPRNYFNSEIFPIYGIGVTALYITRQYGT